MPIQRVFIDWTSPILPRVAEQLASQQPDRDFSDYIAVLPGRQAGRRFLELLTVAAGGSLHPPEIVTVGALPELLYTPQRPFACPLTQQFAWVRALQSLPPSQLQHILRVPPSVEDTLAWLNLAALLGRQHTELAADRLRFSDVARLGPQLEDFDEAPRWEALAAAQAKYLSILDDLQLWDLQTARLVALEKRECATTRKILAIGAVDLTRTLREMLAQVAEQVTVYLHAPESHRDDFDEVGCLFPARWQSVQVPLREEQMLVRDDTAGQCAGIMDCLRELNGQFALNDVTIAVPEESLVPSLRGALADWDVPTFHPVERPLSATGPYRLLEGIAEYCDGRRSRTFAAVIRHPDLTAFLDAQLEPGWLNDWDEHFLAHLPRSTPLMLVEGTADERALRLRDTVDALLEPLAGLQPLSNWGRVFEDLFERIYGDREFQRNSPTDMQTLAAVQQLAEQFRSQTGIPEQLDSPISAVTALQISLLQAASQVLYRAEGEPAVHLAGWLELPLDDAPVAILTSFNEGFVPSAVNHDIFLPDQLRAHLGIEDNSRRYARDLHALLALLASRQHVRVICARRDFRGDPLAPSRLLLAAEPDVIAQRILRFYESTAETAAAPATRRMHGTHSLFEIPKPVEQPAPLTKLRVTAFRDYLESPYRFYLRHVQQLNEVSDDVCDLDPRAFGNLLHGALRDFGEGASRTLTDSREIERYLHRQLALRAQATYGDQPLATVRIQFEQARLRLSAFAVWQAEWRAQGWQIYSVENQSDPTPFALGDGRTLLLTGRIDRIDYHPQSGEWFIFDYKSSESPNTPDAAHRAGRKGERSWVDLQLPLYRHLARSQNVEGTVHLGYIALPRDASKTGALPAEWSAADLAEADELARQIGRDVLDQKFWAPLAAPCGTLQEYDDLCLQGVSGQEVLV